MDKFMANKVAWKVKNICLYLQRNSREFVYNTGANSNFLTRTGFIVLTNYNKCLQDRSCKLFTKRTPKPSICQYWWYSDWIEENYKCPWSYFWPQASLGCSSGKNPERSK